MTYSLNPRDTWPPFTVPWNDTSPGPTDMSFLLDKPAGAAGFIDAMGYIGASLAGWGAGVLIKSRGYEVTFVTFGSAAIIGALLVSIIWKVGPQTRPEHQDN